MIFDSDHGLDPELFRRPDLRPYFQGDDAVLAERSRTKNPSFANFVATDRMNDGSVAGSLFLPDDLAERRFPRRAGQLLARNGQVT